MKRIKFWTPSEYYLDVTEAPSLAKKHIPEWYKKIERTESSVKMCYPFFDAMSSGYLATLPCDIKVEYNPKTGLPVITWLMQDMPEIVTERESNFNPPTPDGYWDIPFMWQMFWGYETPKGCSALITHPLNRYDLPFLTYSGIVDSDKFGAPGSLAFVLKKDFEGVIPLGTPIYQILPFKRDSWIMKVDKKLGNKNKYLRVIKSKVFSGWYKNNAWTRKDYR
jgi:hypothetical protein